MAALDLLRAVRDDGAYANLRLPQLLRERGLTGVDAGFATELGYGTLRLQGRHDAVLAAATDRPLERLDPDVLAVLRLGAHQLTAMRVPPHAAVTTSVDLAREVAGPGAAGLVNAVLRRVAARPLDVWLAEVAPALAENPWGHLAVVHSHPRWVVEALAAALGDRAVASGELAELLAADNVAADVTLVARPGRAERADLLRAGAEPGRWSPLAARWSGDPAGLAEVRDGRAAVQDEGSQLVALALGAAPLDGSDDHWLDLAAGPGGKAAVLDGIVRERGGRLFAGERLEHRARLVAAALGGLPAAVVVADGRCGPWPPGRFDRVLLDAPCTGLGVLRRRPEARWRRSPDDVQRLVPLQRALLDAALDAARPGGVVAYATCSPHLAETDEVVAAVLADRDDVAPVDAVAALTAVAPGLAGTDLGGGPAAAPPTVPAARLWPHRHGTDGMYLALLRRRS